MIPDGSGCGFCPYQEESGRRYFDGRYVIYTDRCPMWKMDSLVRVRTQHPSIEFSPKER